MTQDQINVDLFNQVKKLQDYNRRVEAEILTMESENDLLRAELAYAAELLFKRAKSNSDYIEAKHFKHAATKTEK